ncbi:MAG TPA: DUF748 domain-containing protein, partial [Clostridia bacterium]|nr:DUF748 domain-containing protein [Clostridia bacterium]
EAPAQTVPEQSTGPEWAVLLEELIMTGCKLKVEDQQPQRPATFELDEVALNVKGAGTDKKAPISMDLGFRLNQTGTAKIKGKGTLEPAVADVNIGLKDIDLRLAQSYLDPVLGLSILSGSLSTHGDAHYEGETPGTLNASFKGDVQFAKFSCADTRVAKELAAWEDLRFEGITAELSDAPGAGKKVKIANIKWVNPKTTVVIGPDGTLNLPQKPGETAAQKGEQTAPATTDVSETKQAPTTQSAPGSAAGEAFPIEIGTITLENGTFGFTDLSIQPNSALAVEQLGGTIKGISSAMNTTADVDLAGRVGEQSPFAITGKVNPLGEKLFVDLVISNSNAQLSPFTGYMEKYAGHPLSKGRLTTSFHYLIEDQVLKAENKIQIDQLTLGPRNNSPDATSLPVKLGIALLKDSNGRIELDVPVTGRLDDPQFKVGPIVLKVVVNMLVKAATSPFKLLGALVGGGEELSFVEFSPGTTNPAGAELEKLEKLKKALAARPALSVEIQGWIDPAGDRRELALAKLKEEIKNRKFEELKAKKKATGTLETFQIDPEEYQATLRSMVVEQFGTNVAAVIQSNLVATAAAEAKTDADRQKEKASPGFLGKVRDSYKGIAQLAGFGPRRNPAEKKLSRAEREVLGQATPEMMERVLADTSVTITPEEYSTLMNARAKWVQDWLLQQGGVAADRLLLLAPKNVDASYTGQSRATLSLN